MTKRPNEKQTKRATHRGQLTATGDRDPPAPSKDRLRPAGSQKENKQKHTAPDVGTVAGDDAAPPRSDRIDTQLAPGAAAAASADTASTRSGDRWELSPLGRVEVVAMTPARRLRVYLEAAARKSTRESLCRATRTGGRSRSTAHQQEPEHRPIARVGTPTATGTTTTVCAGADGGVVGHAARGRDAVMKRTTPRCRAQSCGCRGLAGVVHNGRGVADSYKSVQCGDPLHSPPRPPHAAGARRQTGTPRAPTPAAKWRGKSGDMREGNNGPGQWGTANEGTKALSPPSRPPPPPPRGTRTPSPQRRFGYPAPRPRLAHRHGTARPHRSRRCGWRSRPGGHVGWVARRPPARRAPPPHQ